MTRLRAAVVTSKPRGNAARITHYLARHVETVDLVAVLVDNGMQRDRRRQRQRIRVWYRHGGPSYALWRLWLHVKPKLFSGAAEPTYRHPMGALSETFGFSVIEVPTVNGPAARKALHELELDLAISISNRVIESDIFSIPRLGMINLHHGRIPEYRGGPPAFWELYNGESTMGISVHRIDDQLDHGQLLARADVPILSDDDPKTLTERARSVDYLLVGETVDAIARGMERGISVDFSDSSVSTLPSRAQLRHLRARLGRPVEHDDYLKAELTEIP